MKLLRSRLPRRFAAKLARGLGCGLLVVMPLASGVQAQEWMGIAGLGVEVKSGKGGALEDATVTLLYRGVFDEQAAGGPAPRATDGKGRVSFSNLALGIWSVRVDHPEHLSYVATVQLSRRDKPQISSSFLEASGRGRRPIRVKLVKAQGQDLGTPLPVAQKPPAQPSAAPEEPPVEVAAETPKKTPPMEPQAVETDEAPTRPAAEKPAEAPPVATLKETAQPPAEKPAEPVEPPAKEPMVAPEVVPPSAQVEPPEERVDVPVAAPERAPEETPEIPAEEPLEAPMQPPMQTPMQTPTSPPIDEPPATGLEEPVEAPIAAATRTAEPATEPSPVPPPAPTLMPVAPGGSVTSYRERTCLECKPGEWGVTSTVTAAAAPDGGCPADALDRVEESVEALARQFGGGLRDFAGPLLRQPQDPILADLSGEMRSRLERSIGGFLQPDSPCRLLILIFPAQVRISGFRFEALEAGRSVDCNGAEPCPLGSARWLANPGIERSAGATFTWALFENQSVDRKRGARITGYFAAPGGWRPPDSP